jgi:histidinol phosphatase-like PHP family hydrolase
MSSRWNEYVGILRHLRQRPEYQGMEILIGLETGMNADGRPKVPQEILCHADLVIASVHKVNLQPGEDVTTLAPDIYWERYRQQIMMAASCPDVDVIGHMEGYLVADWQHLGGSTFADRRRIEKGLAATYFPLTWYSELAEAAVVNKVAVEIHSLSESPRLDVIHLLRKHGVKFTVSSDVHALEQVNQLGYIKYVVDELNLQASDFAACVGLS